MQNPSRRTVLRTAVSLASLAAMGTAYRPASAQNYMGPVYTPEWPWTVIVPFPPGGRSGFIGNRLIDALADVLGENVVMQHKIGDPSSEIEAFTQLASGSRTLLLAMVRLPRRGVFSPDAGNELMSRLEPVALVAREPMVLSISYQTAVKKDIRNLEQLLRYVKKYPGKLTIASSNEGATAALAAELFKSMSQTYINRMSSADLNTDIQSVIDGKIDLIFENVNIARSAIQAGALVPLAYTASPTQPKLNWDRMRVTKPLPLLYDVPELSQYEIYDYHTLFAPPSMDAGERELLSATCTKALAMPNYRERLLASYALPDNLNREQFLSLENQEEARWRKARGRW